eukprot:TRINITY_DN6729_c0_g1_i3.p1 TRINITY_DN6729_c0_g1~~TRINITY_DN6729_c0_g1_i3.p1  ORF type:complete len:921 (+),score=186.36 TRINITY_DN6729_c0_g1_i3:553-3315(+)
MAVFLLLLVVGTIIGGVASDGVTYDSSLSDTFVGPMVGWHNIKTEFGAVGDGVADDTVAFRNALNAVYNPNNPWDSQNYQIWVPAGRYRITDRISVGFTTYTQLIGEDPTTTTIFWGGGQLPECGCDYGRQATDSNGAQCSMFSFSTMFGRVRRLTFDGSNLVGGIIWYNINAYGAVWSRIEDCVFQNAGMGVLQGEEYSATVYYVRTKFLNLGMGICNYAYNGVANFARYCYFENCGYGIFVTRGGVSVDQCAFVNIQGIDYYAAGQLYGSIRGSYSNSVNNAPFAVVNFGAQIIGNTVVRTSSFSGNTAIQYSGWSSGSVVDNLMIIPSDSHAVFSSGWNTNPFSDGEHHLIEAIYTINNTFTCSQGNSYTSNAGVDQFAGHYGDKWIAFESATFTVPVLPGFQVHSDEPIYSVSRTGTWNDIVATVSQACTYSLSDPNRILRATVYIPGLYYWTDEVVVPPYCAVRFLANDGREGFSIESTQNPSALLMSQDIQKPFFRLQSPSRATFEGLTMVGTLWSSSDGIIVENADQKGSRVYAECVDTSEVCGATELVNADWVVVDLDNYTPSSPDPRCAQYCAKFQGKNPWEFNGALSSKGGPCSAQGEPSVTSVLKMHGCGGGGPQIQGNNYADVFNGGRLVVKDGWMEVGATTFVNLTSRHNGTLLWGPTNVAPYAFAWSNGPIFQFDNFPGKFYGLQVAMTPGANNDDAHIIRNMHPDSQIVLLASQYTNNLGEGPSLLPPMGKMYVNTVNQKDSGNPPYSTHRFSNMNDQEFLASFDLLRGENTFVKPVGKFNDKRDGITDVRIHRIGYQHIWRPLVVQGDLNNNVCNLGSGTGGGSGDTQSGGSGSDTQSGGSGSGSDTQSGGSGSGSDTQSGGSGNGSDTQTSSSGTDDGDNIIFGSSAVSLVVSLSLLAATVLL